MPPRLALFLALLLLAAGLCALPGALAAAQAQSYTQTARSFVQAPAVLGRGGAAAAVADPSTAFFYNPAHLARIPAGHVRVVWFGLQGSASANVPEHLAFYRDDLDPALEAGLSRMTDARRARLYDEMLRLGRRRTLAGSAVRLPSVHVRRGPLGVGAGLFAHGLAHYRLQSSSAGVPLAQGTARADLIGLTTAALDLSALGARGLSLGLTAKYTRRYLTVKNKPVDGFDADEDAYLLRGASLGLDLGAHYRLPLQTLPGALSVGGAVFDLAHSAFDYAFARNLTGNAPTDARLVARETARANAHRLRPSYRIGAAYEAPGSVLNGLTVAGDYVGYVDPPLRQSRPAHVMLGAEAPLTTWLTLRAGLRQGYPPAGAGLHVGPARFAYAFYGTEHGRLPGQLPTWQHVLCLTLTSD